MMRSASRTRRGTAGLFGCWSGAGFGLVVPLAASVVGGCHTAPPGAKTEPSPAVAATMFAAVSAATAPAEAAPTTPVVASRAAGTTESRNAVSKPPAVMPFASTSAAPSASVSPPAAPTASVAAPPLGAVRPLLPRRGPVASGPSYDVWLETSRSYDAGVLGSLAAELAAKAPYKCNTQYPYKFILDPAPSGVTYPSRVILGMHVEGKHASMPVLFLPGRAGSFSIGGTLSFSTCTVEQCLVNKVRVTVVVDVR